MDLSQDFQGLKVVGRYEPEPSSTFDPAAHDSANPVTGNYTVYAVIEGVPRPIAQFRAAGLVADISRAQSSGTSDTPSGDSGGEPDVAALEARIAELERNAGKTGPTVETDDTPPQPAQ